MMSRNVRTLRVATNSKSYPHVRNIFDIPCNERTIEIQNDVFRILYKAKTLLPEFSRFYVNAMLPTEVLVSRFFDPFWYRRDLVHTFNTLCVWSGAWICTYEGAIPRTLCSRYGQLTLKRKAAKILSNSSCKKLFAVSNRAQTDMLSQFVEHRAEYAIIESKSTVLHPPQRLMPISRARYDGRNSLRLLFVGHQFFQKGGAELVSAIDCLLKCGADIVLKIVSALGTDNWCSFTTEDDRVKVRELCAKYAERIQIYSQVSNEDVFRLLGDTDIAVLPSRSETYGYFVLEAQATGVPVITTNVGSFPEINDNDAGWVIPVPQKWDDTAREMRPEFKTRQGRKELFECIKNGILGVVETVLNEPYSVETRSRGARSRIKKNHDPGRYAEKLLYVYREAAKG